MCSTQQTQNMPVGGDAGPTVDTGDGGLGQTLATSAAASNPTVPVSSPTKFGTLMKYAAPLLEGALVGWAGGKGHPQGGFGAANDFFAQRRNQQMQQSVLQNQLWSSAVNNAYRMAHANYFAGRTPGATAIAGPANPLTAPLLPGQNPDQAPPDLNAATTAGEAPSGAMPALPASAGGSSPRSSQGSVPRTPPGGGKPTIEKTDQGLMAVSGDTAVPVLARVPRAPSKFDSGTPTDSEGNPVGGKLTALTSGENKPTNPMTDLESGAIAAMRQQHPGWNDDQIYTAVKRAGQKPEKDESVMTPQQERQFRSQYASREEAGLRQLQGEQERDLDKLDGGDADLTQKIDPQYDQKKAAILRRYAGAQKDLHQRLVTEASGLGIDLDTPMTPTKAKGTPTSPPGGKAKSNSGTGGQLSDAAKAYLSSKGIDANGASDRIPVISPTGESGSIPKSQLAAAKKKGYQLAAAPN